MLYTQWFIYIFHFLSGYQKALQPGENSMWRIGYGTHSAALAPARHQVCIVVQFVLLTAFLSFLPTTCNWSADPMKKRHERKDYSHHLSFLSCIEG